MPGGVTFGAIRWDAWWDTSNPSNPAVATQGNLSDADYHFRAPIHSKVVAPNVIQFQTTQANFDNEIKFASSVGGPNFYWAYLLYGEGSAMNAGLNFHLSSTIAGLQRFALMIATNVMGTTATYTSFIDNIVNKYIAQPYYMTLFDGKPLIYIYYSSGDVAGYWGSNIANLATAISYLRTKVTSVKGVAPYVVGMVGASDSLRTQLGVDAVTNYISGFASRVDGLYSQLDSDTRNYWASLKTAVVGSGGHVVPICMMGWNSTPRKRRPTPWSVPGQIPETGMRNVYAYATPTELGTHVAAAVSYVLANPTNCPEKTILCYAWSENDEGGWLTQTLGDPTGTRLAAVGAALA